MVMAVVVAAAAAEIVPEGAFGAVGGECYAQIGQSSYSPPPADQSWSKECPPSSSAFSCLRVRVVETAVSSAAAGVVLQLLK